MSDLDDYNDLRALRSHPGFKKLQALWAQDAALIMESIDKACKTNGRENSLKHASGRWNGFNIAITRLDRALGDMERNIENVNETSVADELLERIREQKQ